MLFKIDYFTKITRSFFSIQFGQKTLSTLGKMSNKNFLCFTKYDKDRLKVIDIGANLADHMNKGMYNHNVKPTHQEDLENVLERAFANHIEKIIITGEN